MRESNHEEIEDARLEAMIEGAEQLEDEIEELRAEAESCQPAAIVPIHIRLALKILLNHVEPGWDNTRAVVERWLIEIESSNEEKN